jgi:hypothetical protein
MQRIIHIAEQTSRKNTKYLFESSIFQKNARNGSQIYKHVVSLIGRGASVLNPPLTGIGHVIQSNYSTLTNFQALIINGRHPLGGGIENFLIEKPPASRQLVFPTSRWKSSTFCLFVFTEDSPVT